jgi:processing peptidase subunit beta
MGSGPNMTSALCRKASELGIAHSISTFNTTYKDTGLFGVYAVAEPTKTWELSVEIMHEILRLCHYVTYVEIECAKTQL